MKTVERCDDRMEKSFSDYKSMLADTIAKCTQIGEEYCIDVTSNDGDLGAIYRSLGLKYGMSHLIKKQDIRKEVQSLIHINERLDKIKDLLET